MSRKNKTKNATATKASKLGMFANNDVQYEARNSVLKKNGLRDMLERFEHKERKNEKITHKNMISLFEKCKDFESLEKSSGHVEFKHKITGVKIGFSGHKKDGTLNINAKNSYAEIIRAHIETLAHNISPLISESKSAKPSC